MNGAADLGGMHGFGPVAPEPGEPRFHADWERRAFALVLAMGATGTWSLDETRFARESIPPASYLSATYYEIWTAALIELLLLHGLVSEPELEAGKALETPVTLRRVLEADAVPAVLAKGAPADRESTEPATFAVGDRVRVRLMNPAGHTRAPRYARGRSGTVTAVHGVHVLPDSNAHRKGEQPTWLYGVTFAAADLWGPDTTAAEVSCDLWEPYLEAA